MRNPSELTECDLLALAIQRGGGRPRLCRLRPQPAGRVAARRERELSTADLSLIPKTAWREAQRRAEMIWPLAADATRPPLRAADDLVTVGAAVAAGVTLALFLLRVIGPHAPELDPVPPRPLAPAS